MGISYLAVALTVFVAFLGILAGLSVAVTKTVNPDGRVSRGFFGGLASAFALVFLCATALLGTGVFVAAVLVGTAIDKNPIESIEIRRDGAGSETTWGDVIHAAEKQHPVSVRFSVAGDGGSHLISFLEDVVGVDKRDLERALTVTPHESGVSSLDVYEFRLPLTPEDLDDMERQIENDLDGINVDLPDSVQIYFEGAAQ
jgi:hypothetical protein